MARSLLIGICGGSGSGKTTLAGRVRDALGDGCVVLSHDSYYRPHRDLDMEARSRLNYDHPDALETTLLVEHLRELSQGRPVACPVYDFAVHDRLDETVRVEPVPVVVVEGILIFADEALRSLFDVRVFVDAAPDVRLARRVGRDVSERGRDTEGVLAQYLETVAPMYEAFVEPYRRYADVVVPTDGAGRSDVACEMVVGLAKRWLDRDRAGRPSGARCPKA